MAKLALKKGSTDVSVYLFAQDSSKTTGAGLTGLAYNTASLTAYYVRPLGSATQITLATQTVTGAHADGGFVEVSSINMPGVYRLDLPDAVCATGVPSAVVMLKGATNLAPVLLEIQLTDFDLNTAFTSALVADAVLDEATSGHTSAGSFSKAVTDILADTGTDGVVVASIATDAITADALKTDAVTEIQNGLALEATLTAIKGDDWTTETLAAIDVLIDAIKAKTDTIAAAPTAASVADAVWDEAIADHTSVGSFGAKNQKVVPSETINDYKADVSGLATTTALSTVSGLVDDLESRLTAARAGYLDNLNTGVALTAAGVDAILDEAVVGSYTLRQLLKVMAAALAGKATGGGTTTVTFRGVDDASDVIVATVDANGNRSAVTLTV